MIRIIIIFIIVSLAVHFIAIIEYPLLLSPVEYLFYNLTGICPNRVIWYGLNECNIRGLKW